jgi:hypothetical protein
MRIVGLRTLLVVSTVVLSSSNLAAQSLKLGDRVRIVVPESQPQGEAPLQRRIVLRGEVAYLRADTVFLRIPRTVGTIGVPLSNSISVHRSRGVPSRVANALRLGMPFGVAGAAYIGLTYSDRRDYGVTNRWEAWALGAGVGAFGGALLGALFPLERWLPVPR